MQTPPSFFARVLVLIVTVAACATAQPQPHAYVSTSRDVPPTTTSTTSTTTSTTTPPTPGEDVPPTTLPRAVAAAQPDDTSPEVEPQAVSYDNDVERVIHDVFEGLGGQATRVANCESGLDPTAQAGPNYGLFQISDVHADQWRKVIGRSMMSSWSDPDANARFALWLYHESHGWGPWACRWAA